MSAKPLTDGERETRFVEDIVSRLHTHMLLPAMDMTDACILVERVLVGTVQRMERSGCPPETLDLICERAKERRARLQLVANAKGTQP